MTVAMDYPALRERAGVGAFENVVIEFRRDTPTNRRKVTSAFISPGVVDDEAIEWFAYGNCWLLAGALHERSGWPLAGVADTRPWDGLWWRHIGVIEPGGLFLDIQGARPHPVVLEQHNGTDIVLKSLREWERLEVIPSDGWRAKCLHPLVLDTVQYFAERLIAAATL